MATITLSIFIFMMLLVIGMIAFIALMVLKGFWCVLTFFCKYLLIPVFFIWVFMTITIEGVILLGILFAIVYGVRQCSA